MFIQRGPSLLVALHCCSLTWSLCVLRLLIYSIHLSTSLTSCSYNLIPVGLQLKIDLVVLSPHYNILLYHKKNTYTNRCINATANYYISFVPSNYLILPGEFDLAANEELSSLFNQPLTSTRYFELKFSA